MLFLVEVKVARITLVTDNSLDLRIPGSEIVERFVLSPRWEDYSGYDCRTSKDRFHLSQAWVICPQLRNRAFIQ